MRGSGCPDCCHYRVGCHYRVDCKKVRWVLLPCVLQFTLVSLWRTRSGDKFLSRWKTSVFLSQQGFDPSSSRATLHHQVRSVKKVTGRHHHEHHGQTPMSMFCSLAELSFLRLPCACIKQHVFVISVWAGGGVSWRRLSWISLQLSSLQCQAQVTLKKCCCSFSCTVHPAMPAHMAALPLLWQQHTPKGKGAANHKPHWRDHSGCARTAQVNPQCKTQIPSTDQPGSKAITASTPSFSNQTWGTQERFELVFHNLCLWGHTNLPDMKISPCSLDSHDTSP